MGRLRTELHRTLVHPISKLVGSAVDGFGSAVDGLSGRGRKRRFHALEIALDDAYAERDRLQAEIQDFILYTDTELATLKQANETLSHERDVLQLQVWTLEEQITNLLQMQNHELSALETDLLHERDSLNVLSQESVEINQSVEPSSPKSVNETAVSPGDSPPYASPTPQEISAAQHIDLSNLRLALVGGHPTTRRGVIQELSMKYGLRHWVEVPRMNESNTNRSKVKSKIGQCTLVVLITGYMSHRLTEIIFSLKEAGSLAGDVVQLNCKGKSGVVRGILDHVEQLDS